MSKASAVRSLPRRPSRAALLALAWLVVRAADPAGAAEARICFNDWPPYASGGPDGAHGISVAIVEEAGRRAGIPVSLTELPWNRCLDAVRRGAMDAVLDAAQRAEFLQGPASSSVYSDTVWVREDSVLLTSDLAALRHRRLGLVAGYDYRDSLAADIRANDIVVDYAVDDPGNLRKLVAGRVDAIIGDFAGTAALVRAGDMPVRALMPVRSTDPLYLSFRKDRPDLHREFDRQIAILLEEGFVDAVYRAAIGVPFSRIVRQ